MPTYTLVKVFSLSRAPAELRESTEGQILRTADPDLDSPLLMVWVGQRTSSFEPPKPTLEPSKVTAWEHQLHKWLTQSGAEAGDIVLLTWGALSGDDANGHATDAKTRRPGSPDVNHGLTAEGNSSIH